MEETAIPLHSWFRLAVPMLVVFLLSILNYLRLGARVLRSHLRIQHQLGTAFGGSEKLN